MKNKISACLVVYNEEIIIRNCLESIKDTVDEIIVVHDGECEDRTLEICKNYTDKIFIREHIGDAEPHRSFSFKQATGDWILQIDADEFLSEELRNSLRNSVNQDKIDGYCFRWRLYDKTKGRYIFGPKSYKPILFRKNKMYFIGVPHYSMHSRGVVKKSEFILGHLHDQLFFKKRLKIIKQWAKIQAGYLVKNFDELNNFQATEEDWEQAFAKTKKFGHIIIIPFVFIQKLIIGILKSRLRISFPIIHSLYYVALIYYYHKAKRNYRLFFKNMHKSKKKILFLDHTPFIGGAQLSLIQHLEKINRDKFDIIIGCSKKAREIGLTEQYDNLDIKYYLIFFGKLKSFNPLIIFRFFKSIFEVKKLTKKESIDLVVSNTVRTALISSLAVWLSKIKTIWLIRDFTFPLLFFRLFSYFSEKIIFNSQATALHYKNYFRDPNKEVIVYIGRNFYEKVAVVSQGDVIKQRQIWQANNKIITIGYIGRLVNWKGPQILIKAVDLLVKQGIKNIKCIIVGNGKGQEGDNEKELKKMVDKLNLGKYVIFTGYQKDLAAIMLSLDILVLTSIEPEPFSSTVIDAMMAKVPVIGTNTGGTPEIIKDYQTGLLVELNNEVDLGRAIKKLINDKALRERVIKNAYNRVMKYHKAEYTTKQLEDIYTTLIT